MNDDDFDRWIARARSEDFTDEEVATLACNLAESGERIEAFEKSADLASTGGPGSLSTLWAPAILAASGYMVPKLGVPGRPAGGVDTLAQVPGYRVNLNRVEAQAVLDDCGYVHLLAGNHFAPADAAMFAYRQQAGAQAVPALAIASLLAKKLSMGLRLIGLEVRVAPHGNFGSDVTAARHNARRFCRVAQRLGLDALCILTDGNRPQQPYLGRGEGLLGLARIMQDGGSSWLEEHTSSCEEWSSALIRAPAATRSAATQAFSANLTSQGGSLDGFWAKASEVAAGHTRTIEAAHDGIIDYDIGALRKAILVARMPDGALTFDDSAGVILLVQPGSLVKFGDAVVSVRCEDKRWPALNRDLAEAIKLASIGQGDTPARRNRTLETIGVGSR